MLLLLLNCCCSLYLGKMLEIDFKFLGGGENGKWEAFFTLLHNSASG